MQNQSKMIDKDIQGPSQGTSSQEIEDPSAIQVSTPKQKDEKLEQKREPKTPKLLPLPELPVPKPEEAAKELGVLPPTDLFVEEYFRRNKYLASDFLKKWIKNNCKASVPSQQVCGICSCNFSGMPVSYHRMEHCPIPVPHRPRFMANNTKSICLRCLGKSDYHDACPDRPNCEQCEDFKNTIRVHTPLIGVCDIPEDRLETLINEYRRQHYMDLVEESMVNPFKIKFYNDEPMRRRMRRERQVFGYPAFVDEREEIGLVRYIDDANYEGLIPFHYKHARGLVDKKIADYQRIYYTINQPNRPNPPAHIKAKIDNYFEVKQQNDLIAASFETEKHEREGQVDGKKGDEQEYGKPELSPSHEVRDSAQAKDNHSTMTSGEAGGAAQEVQSKPVANKERTEDFVKRTWIMTKEARTELDPEHSQYLPSEEETKNQWWTTASNKLSEISKMPEDIKERFIQATVSNSFVSRSGSENQVYKTNIKNVKKQELQLTMMDIAVKEKCSIEEIKYLQRELTGTSDPAVWIDELSKEHKEPKRVKYHYLELLMKIGVILVNTKKENPTAKLTPTRVRILANEQPYNNTVIVPDFEMYKDMVLLSGEEFVMLFIHSIAKAMLE